MAAGDPLRNLDFVEILDPRTSLWKDLVPGTFIVDGQDIYSGETICHAKLSATGHWYTCVAIVAAFLFIMSLKGLSEVKTARWGCIYGTIGMSLAIIGTWFGANVCNDGVWLMWIGIIPGALVGAFAAIKVTMIQMPQLVGLLNAFGGLASAICAIGLFIDPMARHGPNGAASPPSERVTQSVALYLAVIIGSITFWGSIVACLKLMGTIASKARILPARFMFNILFCLAMIAVSIIADGVTDTDYHGVATVSEDDYLANAKFGFGTGGGIGMIVLLFIISALWGIQFVFAIGGADMPVVICVLNTGSGIAGVFAGFMLASRLLVITGTFVASSGVILSIIMCVAMNRSIGNVLIGGFGETSGAPKVEQVIEGEKKETNTEEFADILNTSKTMIIVPGYGMAAGKAQHAVAALVRTLRDRGVSVKFAIHPVAGRLPGHMNVLLAEAQVPYDIVFAMDDINGDFEKTDVVLVLGANDIVNPAAAEDPTSPIAGMPVLEVWNAKKTFVVKRGGGTGYAGVENPLFFKENNFMYYGNAMKKMEEINAKIMTLDKVGGDDVNMNGVGKSVFEKIEVEVKETVPPCAEPKIIIGVLTENVDDYERRVALDPATCMKLTKLNYGILLHKGAGARSGYMDQQYMDSGCIIKESREDVISGSHVINTVMPTTELLECSPLLKDKFVICWIGKLTPDGKALVEKVAAAGINLIDVTSVPRITIAQKLDVLSSQAKIAGVRGTIEAAALYQRFFPLEMTAAGKYPQAQVMVLGVGVAGLAAIGQARALGAEVRAWDVRDVSDQVESMGGKWITVDFEEEGAGGGGYAKESSQAFQEAQKATFHRHAKECDIIITTAAIPGRKSPVLIEEYMVKDMKPGSVIIDLAAMGGGNCQLTRKNETYLWEGKVTICGALDFPSRMAMQASDMFGTNMYNLYQHIAVAGAGAKADAGDVIPTIDKVMKKEMEEVVTSQVMCSYKGEVLNPGPPPMPAPPAPKKKEDPSGEKKAKGEIKKVSTMGDSFLTTSQFGSFLVFVVCVLLAVLVNDPTLIDLVLVFMLAAWVGYILVADVEPALHTPLMSVSNAISGQVILGGIVMVSSKTTGTAVLGVIACFVASINVFGGFVITLQMLDMFVTDKKAKVANK